MKNGDGRGEGGKREEKEDKQSISFIFFHLLSRPLVIACSKGHREIAKAILDVIPNDRDREKLLNITDGLERSLLMKAIKGGHTSILQLLLIEYGINVNYQTQGWMERTA